MLRSIPSNFDDNEQANSTDEQSSIRSVARKKKKVIGAGAHRLHGDGLPPLAPSSAASRRDDFIQNKRPPAGTPRPQPVVAQWAITSPSPHSTAEKLTTIASDHELDNDEETYKSLKPNKRIVSPHPITTNRIKNDKKGQLTTINNDDDDNTLRRSLSVQKSRSKLSDDDDDDDAFGDNRKKTNSREQDRYSKQRYDRNNDNDDDDDFNYVSSRRAPSSTRKTSAGNSSHRSDSRTNGNVDDDLR